MVFVLSLFSIKKDYSKLFELFTGDKPSVESPIQKPRPDGFLQSDSASEQGQKVGGDTIKQKEEKVPESTKESGEPGDKKETSSVELKQI